MRVLVCGGRNFRDKVKVWGWLQAVHLKRGIECIIHGDAPVRTLSRFDSPHSGRMATSQQIRV
ncbi:MAG: SLOG family protein [Rhizobiaceae bacterium]